MGQNRSRQRRPAQQAGGQHEAAEAIIAGRRESFAAAAEQADSGADLSGGDCLQSEPDALIARPVAALASDPALGLADRFGFEGDGLIRLVASLEAGTWDDTSPDGARASFTVSTPRPRWIDRAIVPVRDGAGATIGLLLVFSDVTRERELAQAREDLSRMIVHDLRGPLTAISTGLKLLREQAGGHGALGEAVIQTTDTSGRAVRKMLGLVDSLLDIAKFENGVMVLEREPVLFPLVSRGVIEEYAPLAEDLKIALRADLPDDLPALYVDEEKVERVLLNLVDNAMKFAPANGQVVVRAATIPVAKGAGPMVQVMVEDDGAPCGTVLSARYSAMGSFNSPTRRFDAPCRSRRSTISEGLWM